MRFVLAAGLVVSLSAFSGVSAQTVVQRTEIHMIVENNRALDGTTVNVASGEAVINSFSRSPRAVRLKEKVEIGAIGTTVALPQDTVLFGRYDNTVWTYCAVSDITPESRVASEAATAIMTAGFSLLLMPFERQKSFNCLYDTDGDGRFDTAWGGGAVDNVDSRISFTMSKRTLMTQPSYERVDPSEGPASPIELLWRKKKNSPQIDFYTTVGGDTFSEKSVVIPAIGSAAEEFNMLGATLLLNGYDAANNTVSVTIKEGFNDFYIRFPAIHTITYTY